MSKGRHRYRQGVTSRSVYRVHRNVELGPERKIIEQFQREGVDYERLECHHVLVAQPIVSEWARRLKIKVKRRCGDCAVVMRTDLERIAEGVVKNRK